MSTTIDKIGKAEPGDAGQKKEEKRKERRRERVHLGGPRTKMGLAPEAVQYFQDKGLVPRWVNDDQGRVEEMERRGYRFVERKELSPDSIGRGGGIERVEGIDSRVSMITGSRDYGAPVISYLMVQEKEFYDEDQQDKEDLIKKKEDAMRAGVTEQVESKYIPSQGIKIERGR